MFQKLCSKRNQTITQTTMIDRVSTGNRRVAMLSLSGNKDQRTSSVSIAFENENPGATPPWIA